LLELQRTNLLTYSEDFSNAAWIKTSTTVNTNASISPNGTLNADSLFETANSASHQIWKRPSMTAGQVYTQTFFIKSNGRRRVQLQIYDSTSVYASALYDVISGTVISTNGTSTIKNYGNGWYRCVISGISPTTSTGYCSVNLAQDNFTQATSVDVYLGDVTKGIYIWGAQYEEGSYPTSYIVSNSGSATTRLAEVCNGSGNASTFNDSEGVLMAQIGNISEDNTTTLSWAISDGSVSNAVSLYYFGVSGLYYDIFNSDGIRSGNAPMTKLQQANNNKIALKYKSQDISLFVNGFELSTNNGTLSLNGLSEVSFDYGNGGFPFYGKTKQLQYFDSALTDSELETLTSWMSFSDMAIDLNYTIQ